MREDKLSDIVEEISRTMFANFAIVLYVSDVTVYRTVKRRCAETGRTYPWLMKSTAMVNHYYFYCVDKEFGPFFIKFCSYFPYNARLCLNGHEYAKRQLVQRGIGFEAPDNAILACDNPAALQRICNALSATRINALLRRWLARLPHPFTAADHRAGFRYQLSMLQAEFALTQVLDRPLSGRVFFERVIRDNIDLGRPKNVQLILFSFTGGKNKGLTAVQLNGHDLVLLGQEAPGHARVQMQILPVRPIDAQVYQTGAAQEARRHDPGRAAALAALIVRTAAPWSAPWSAGGHRSKRQGLGTDQDLDLESVGKSTRLDLAQHGRHSAIRDTGL